MALSTVLTIALAACGSGDENSASAGRTSPTESTSTSAAATETGTGLIDPTLERPENLDPVQQFAFDGMASGLREAVDELERGEDPTISCTSVLAYAEGGDTTGLEAAVQKAQEQCGREIPIAWATRQLDTVEATGDIGESIGECASALVSLDLVEERYTDPRVTELRTRADQLCA
ncbi:hypothetical protein ACI782_05830 [Geodermatophilus sp. SYSU D00703]